jgi:hypothetical protein
MVDPELRREIFSEVKLAGIVPVPVAAMTDGSACWRSHSMVSPSDLCPSSLVSWKTLAAHAAGMRIRRPRPSTFVCLSLVEFRFGGALVMLFVVSGGSWPRAVLELERAEELGSPVGMDREE